MDIKHLQYFVAIVDQSTFTKAANVLHISQPSLSVAMKRLEDKVGFPLIDRTSRHIQITKEGKIMYQEAKKLLKHYENVSDEMRRLKEEGPLELSIGLIESSMFFVPKILSVFKQEFTKVRVRLLETLSLDDVEKALNNFDIHVAITNQYIHNSDIETIPIYKENLVALLPPNHYLENKDCLQLTDFEGEDFIVSKEGFQTRTDILNAFKKSGVDLNIQFEIERFETCCSLVENNLGITIIPENYAHYSKKTSCSIKRIDDSTISRTVYLAHDKNRYLSPLVMSFITSVKEWDMGTGFLSQPDLPEWRGV
ncbi:LysR family transcriptional regulator [Lentibacillus sp. Marseille-P4043]|uniref:LysR family transcriptional regulator n=1 Tax=Lentibacillus sp. Marseille-P4043 TaxID=2040293 RepID=UPI000D0B0AB1|nr:LysR family transcriptional regulator [Lentibacillus sp. Marseille-P4043]